MAFENIEISSLKNSLNACKDSINNNISINLVGSLADNNIWSCNSKTNLINGLKDLNSIYEELEKEINNLLGISNLISEYKELQAEVNNLERQYSNLKGKLYYDESYKDWYVEYDEVGNEVWDYNWETRRVKDVAVENQMISTRNTINELLNEMSTLENRVNNLI